MTYPADYVFQGAVVRYMANVYGALEKSVLENAVRSATQVQSINVTTSGGGDFNISADVISAMDRRSILDIKSNIDDALLAIGLTMRASAVRFVSNPRRDGSTQGGTIPAGVPGDTYHTNDSAIGNALTFWLDQTGQQVKGLVQAISQGSPTMWVGVGIIALLIISNRK